jgi:acyl carrier protein
MNKYEELNDIFKRVFDDDEIEIKPETTADDIDGWDSLSHVNLLLAIERHFKINFKTSEVISWKTVARMHDSIISKLSERSS